MNKKTKRNVAISIVLAVLCFCLIMIITNHDSGDTQTSQDETQTVEQTDDSDTYTNTDVTTDDEDADDEDTDDEDTDDEDTDVDNDNSTYVDVSYEKELETVDLTGTTEDDLADNEFLVNAIIFTYTGDDNYEITKGSYDADLIVIDDSGSQINCHIEVTSMDEHKDIVSSIIEKENEYIDSNGTYFYFDVDTNMKTLVSIKYKKYITIQCDDASMFDVLDVRSSELDCC